MGEQEIERYEQMLAKDPKSRAFAPLAELYRKMGRIDDAIEVADQGLKHNPKYAGGLVVMGRALFEKKDFDRAIEIMQRAVQEAPENYLAQKFLGKVLGARGHNERAIRALEAANLISPGDREVESDLAAFRAKVTAPKTISFEASAAAQGAEFTHRSAPPPLQSEPEPPAEEMETLAPMEELVEVESFSIETEEAIAAPLEEAAAASFEVPIPAPLEEAVAAQVEELESVPLHETPSVPEPAARAPVAAEEGIATETLADLYAKQGFSDRAAQIYRQLLDRRPGDGALMLKLAQIDQAAGLGTDRKESPQATPSPPLAPSAPAQAPEPPRGYGRQDAAAVLEGWLANLERMKVR